MDVVNITRVGDELYLDAYLIRNICKANIIPREQVQPGEPDVVVKSLLGDSDRIGRGQLVSGFSHVNGKKIHINAWKRGKANLVMPRVNNKEVYRAFYVPEGIQVCIDSDGSNRMVSGGNYIVFDDDNYKIAVIPKNMFLKMFKMQGQIERTYRSNKKSSLDSLADEWGSSEDYGEYKEYSDTSYNNEQNSLDSLADEWGSSEDDYSSNDTYNYTQNVQSNEPNNYNAESDVDWNKFNEDTNSASEELDAGNMYLAYEPKKQEKTYKFTAIGKILGEDDKIVGFMLKDNNGIVEAVDKKIVNKMAMNKEIANIGIREKDGKKYIYGKDRPLSELPTMG